MFGKAKRDHSKRNLAQYGIFNVSADDDDGGDDLIEDDSDLEAELLALSGGGSKRKPRQRKAPVPTNALNSMVTESLKDVPSDEDVSVDEDDPELLSELGEIAGDEMELEEPVAEVTDVKTDILIVLENRLGMYETAEKNAKEAGETSRARRFGRGIKTLKDLIKKAKAGSAINNDDIPPEVAVKVHPHENVDSVTNEVNQPQPTRPAPTIPSSEPAPETKITPENEELLRVLNTRKMEYKMAALQAKKAGDSNTAINYIKIAKQFETVIKAVENGQPVDISNMPGPPTQETPHLVQETNVQSENVAEEQPIENDPEITLITASSVAEALQQRIEVYQKQEQTAKEQGNASKARRMGRIVKQYEDAIKRNKAGKPIPVEDLPTPPGFAPIPVEGSSSSQPEILKSPPKSAPAHKDPSPTSVLPPVAKPKSNAAQSRINKQVALLMKRQKEFKDAALIAKRKGEITQAKEFLRTSKGFEPLIEAAKGGLPVDLSTLPIPPSAKSQLIEDYELVNTDEINPDLDPEHADILSRLEEQLLKQLKLSLSTRDHNKAIGDVAGTNRFEQMAVNVTKDLDVVRLAKKLNSGLPKFHYETKSFSIVKSFTDLNDNDLELTVMRGLNYNCSNPDDIDTYVKFEFPFPQEDPVRNKTAVIRNTNNPEYNETFILPIQRNSRQCLRLFKRHGIKFEIFSKGGFFRGDSLMGTTTVKLQPLETQCELHESFELVEGRKKVGGKLEIRLRVRDPLLTKQIEQLSEKWLILDH